MRISRASATLKAYFIPIAASTMALFLWLVRLVSCSLWLDETITFWISSRPFPEALRRLFLFQNNGPLYFVAVWPFAHLLPKSEAGLRSLSALSFFVLLLVLFKLAKLCLDHQGAVTATLLFITSEGVLSTFANARPYAPSLLLVVTCVYYAVLWVNHLKLRHLLVSATTGVAAFYTHYLLVPVLLVVSVYMIITVLRSHESGRRQQVDTTVAVALMAILAIPSIAHLKFVQAKKGILHFSDMPNLNSLLAAWLPARLLLFCLASLIVLAIVRPRMRLSWANDRAKHLGLLLSWYGFPPLCLFLFSHFTNASTFHPRYLIWSLPAGSILAAYVIQCISPKRTRRIFVCLVVTGLALAATKNDLLIERWSDAVNWIQQSPDLTHTTVLASTMLLEAADTSFLEGNDSRAYLLSPFSFYRLDALPLPLPLWFDQDGARKYLEAEVRPALAGCNHAVLVARVVDMHSNVNRTSPMIRSDVYLAARLSEWGWKIGNQHWFGRVTVIDLQRHP